MRIDGAQRNPLAGIPSILWRAIALADRRLLATDYDGALAPFHADRHAAVPNPNAMRVLGRLTTSTHTRVAVVSGRPLEDLIGFLGAMPVRMVGEHGWVERSPAGEEVRHPIPDLVRDALEQARTAAEVSPSGALEVRRASLVLHTRALARDAAAALEAEVAARWEPLANQAGLRLDRIDGGLEIRATQRDKGKAVRALIAAEPPGTLTVFVGDDVTDEDGFEAATSSGFGVRVGTEDRPSRAAGRLPDTAAVADFLEEWSRLAERGQRPRS